MNHSTQDLSPIAQLPMYDWPEVRSATNTLWRSIAMAFARHRVAAPKVLDRSIPVAKVWRSPNLLLAQTCGLPYVRHLRDTVRVLGAMAYDLPGCRAGDYHSVLVVHQAAGISELKACRGVRVAINSEDSYSGCLALDRQIAAFCEGPFFGERIPTGSHRQSIRAVARGIADLAAIDCVTWALACKHEPATERVRVIGTTNSRPGLPLITSRLRSDADCEALQTALEEAVAQLEKRSRDALRLLAFVRKKETDYDCIVADEQRVAQSL